MPFDTTYAADTLVAIPLNFLTSGSPTFNPESRDDTRNLGRREADQSRQAISFMETQITEDFGVSMRYNGFAGKGIITAISQGTIGAVSITEKEFDGNDVSRPRNFLTLKALSKKAATPTGVGNPVSIWAPSTAIMGSLAVIIDAAGLSKIRNFTFNLIRVENTTGAPLTAGQAVAFSAAGTGSMPKVVATNGDIAGQDFVGILAEDIADTQVGACYSGAGGGAALVPRTVAVAASAALQAKAILSAAASPGAYDPVGGAATQQIGVWKHVGGAGTASILLLGTTL